MLREKSDTNTSNLRCTYVMFYMDEKYLTLHDVMIARDNMRGISYKFSLPSAPEGPWTCRSIRYSLQKREEEEPRIKKNKKKGGYLQPLANKAYYFMRSWEIVYTETSCPKDDLKVKVYENRQKSIYCVFDYKFLLFFVISG